MQLFETFTFLDKDSSLHILIDEEAKFQNGGTLG